MTDYYRRYVVGDAPATMQAFIRVIQSARSIGLPALARSLEVALIQMEQELTLLGQRTVAIADTAIKDAIFATAKRAPQTEAGGLLERVMSEVVIPTAAGVGIARLDSPGLNELPYWRAQNYGLSTQNFLGRRIFGLFYDLDFSNPQVPGAARGQARFHPTTLGGPGVIRRPIKPRHFLEAGDSAALAHWQQGRLRIETKAISEITAASTRLATVQAAGALRRRR
jgi:hypothetical protein